MELTTLNRYNQLAYCWGLLVYFATTAGANDVVAPSIDFVTSKMFEWQYSIRNLEIEFAHVEYLQQKATDRSSVDWDRTILVSYRIDQHRIELWRQTNSVRRRVYFADAPIVTGSDFGVRKFWPGSRNYLEDLSRPPTRWIEDKSWACEWGDNLGLWFPKSLIQPASALYIPEAFGNYPYRILPEKQQMADRDCWVVVLEGIDKVWLDPNLDFVPVFREWSPSNEENASLSFELYDFRKVGTCFVPFGSRCSTYIRLPDNSKINTLVSCCLVNRITMNPVFESNSYQPGSIVTRVRLNDQRERVAIQGGEEFLISTAMNCRKHVSKDLPNTNYPQRHNFIVPMNLFAVFVSLFWPVARIVFNIFPRCFRSFVFRIGD